MKTAIIYNTFEELSYYVVEGDLRKFNGIYVNMVPPENYTEEQYDNLSDEMINLLDTATKTSLDDFARAIRSGANVIECGFLL